MFEKEAEKYTFEHHCRDCWMSGANVDGKCLGLDFCGSHSDWSKGAEFGYNKANEWHYPSEGEYPKEYRDLWICFVTEDDMKDYVRGWYEYDFDEDKHIFKTVNEITQILENVYAWKEIVPPKEIEK